MPAESPLMPGMTPPSGAGGATISTDAKNLHRLVASAALDSSVIARSGLNRDRPEKEGLSEWAAERPEGSADQSLSGTPTRDSRAVNEMWNS